jgi:hypothetical protein
VDPVEEPDRDDGRPVVERQRLQPAHDLHEGSVSDVVPASSPRMRG